MRDRAAGMQEDGRGTLEKVQGKVLGTRKELWDKGTRRILMLSLAGSSEWSWWVLINCSAVPVSPVAPNVHNIRLNNLLLRKGHQPAPAPAPPEVCFINSLSSTRRLLIWHSTRPTHSHRLPTHKYLTLIEQWQRNRKTLSTRPVGVSRRLWLTLKLPCTQTRFEESQRENRKLSCKARSVA